MKYIDFLRSLFISPEFVILAVAILIGDYKFGQTILSNIKLTSAPIWTIIPAQIIGIGWFIANQYKVLLYGNNESEKDDLINFPKRYMLYNRIISGLIWLLFSTALTIIGIAYFLDSNKYLGLLLCITGLAIYIFDGLTLIFAGFILSDILHQKPIKTSEAKK